MKVDDCMYRFFFFARIILPFRDQKTNWVKLHLIVTMGFGDHIHHKRVSIFKQMKLTQITC